MPSEREKPYWVVLRLAHLFIAGYDTKEEAEAYAAFLNQRASDTLTQPPPYLVIPRPGGKAEAGS